MSRRYIVNEADEVIGVKEGKDVLPHEIERVSALWLTNSKGEVLIAQRALTKRFGPGEWGTAVAGTVEEGEDYLDNIIKETQEEIGVVITTEELTVGPKELWNGDHHKFFLQWYVAHKDVPLEDLAYPPEEVAAVEWVPLEQLQDEIRTHKRLFTDSLKNVALDFKYGN